MNKFFTLLFATLATCLSVKAQETMEQDLFESMREDDKAAIITVHKDTESGIGRQGIDLLNLRLREIYPNYDFREACTTKGAMGQTPDPDELLNQLHKDGYTHILIQPSNFTNDLDVQYLRHIAESAKGKFKHLRMGEPLLSEGPDYQMVADIAIHTFSVMPKGVNVLVCSGDGEDDPSYMMLDYTLHDKSDGKWLLAATNGVPSLSHLIKVLKMQKVKKVQLVPFCPEVTNMMRNEWVKRLQQAGYKVTVESRCLSEQKGITDLFEQHVRHAEKFRRLNAKEQKIITR